MLISRKHGNWLFLAAVLTTLEFESDAPVRKDAEGRETEPGLLCGKCSRCMDACPTQALPKPGVVDARRCISYQTIENKGIIPRELREGIGNHLYGCDVCLEVCPWNRFAQAGRRMLLSARYDLAELTLRDILELTPERFAEVFRKTAIKRVKITGLLRNACVVAGNTAAHDCLDVLVRIAGHASPVVRAHAVWAVRRLGAGEQLASVRAAETDSAVLAEYEG
jgi:epoxyqueuosine reductase